MSAQVQTAVLGVTGYAGAELARLLLHHPRLKGTPPIFAGRVDAEDAARGGIPLVEIHPQLGDNNGAASLRMQPFSWELLAERGAEVLFLATPHEQSREWVPAALERGLRVIDLSGAWRLNDAANRAVYAFKDEGSSVATAIQARAIYGMPELHRAQIAGAELVANPGCYATSVILPLQPLVAARPHRSRPWNRGRLEERRERRGQGSHTEDAFHVCGRQSLRIWRLLASPHRRIARANRRRQRRDRFYAAPAAHSARHSVHDLRAVSRAANARDRRCKRIASFLPAVPWCGSTIHRCRRFNTRCEPTTPTSAFNLPPTAGAQ